MNKRLTGIDLLRGFSAFGIVACHLMLYPGTAVGTWIQHFCDVNVAVFAAVAGFVMSERIWTQPIVDYLKSRARRLLPAYLLWSVVFVLTSAAFKFVGHEPLGYLSQISYWLNVVFKGSASCHLWFLVSLFYAQIILRMTGVCRRPPTLILAGVAMAVICLSTVSEDWWFKYFARLVGFLFSGVVLRCFLERAQRLGMFWLLVLTFVAVGAHIGLQGVLPQYVRDLIVTCPVVLLFASVRIETERVIRVSSLLAGTSLTVYLVHPIFTKIGGLVTKKICAAPYGVVPVVADWIVCYLAAFVFALIVRSVAEAATVRCKGRRSLK